MIRRLFVEKKSGYDTVRRRKQKEIENAFSVTLEDMRMLLRYDIQGMDDEDYAAYESWLKENLAFTYISDYRDHMFSEDELTDSISHLTREAAREHSNIYAEELIPYMRADGYPV